MVKLKGELLSMAASGTIGGAVTYSNWKGRPYAKKFSQPTNNQQNAQLGLRAAMTWISSHWTTLSTADQETWEGLAGHQTISPFNAYLGQNLTRIVNGYGATKAYPPTSTPYTPSTIIFGATSEGRWIKLNNSKTPPPDAWSMMYYRDQASGFTPALANLVHFANPGVFPTKVLTRDDPPSAGTWYYRIAASDDNGNVGLDAAEHGATTT